MNQQVRFCESFDGTRIAYALTGQGPTLVRAPHWFTHLEHDWRNPAMVPWVEDLSRRYTLVRFDQRGTGLSDRDVADISFDAQMRDLQFAWTVCKHVRSNAIVLAKDEKVVGVGAGQMSRLDSAFIAVRKAGDRAKGSVVASDAFFPFPDALETCLEAGASAVIQPSGSIRDEEVISVARKRNIPMVLTGMRHFKH